MALTQQQIQQVEAVLRNSLRHKFQNYNPEPGAVALSLSRFSSVDSQQNVGTVISTEAQRVIQNIIDNLYSASAVPNKEYEIEEIRKVCQVGELKHIRSTKVDLKIVDRKGSIFLFDLKTAKPNAGAFKEFKRTLLEWVAITLATDPKALIQSSIAIPYNPYEPQPYSRWTMRGMLDLENELKVAAEFWDFLGGRGTYNDLLDIFERIGKELKPEIDAYFSKYNK